MCINDLPMARLFWTRSNDHISNALVAAKVMRSFAQSKVSIRAVTAPLSVAGACGTQLRRSARGHDAQCHVRARVTTVR